MERVRAALSSVGLAVPSKRIGINLSPAHARSRAPKYGRNYSARISGLMMDRFDIIIEVPEVSGQLLFSTKPTEALSTIAASIVNACWRTLRSCCDSQWKNDSSQRGAFTR